MARRERIAGPGIPEHTNPFSAAVKIGNLVFSAAVGGDDPETHDLPTDKEGQIKNAFKTVRNILKRAGGSPENIAKMTVYVEDRSIRPMVNPYWIEMFPREENRPVRHFMSVDMPPGRHIQLEFIAVLD